ncbi:MAG: ABC transporter permease [Bacteroidales bacterium]|nr:ABC transporter permease [Bacteroidales bacterium]
MERNRTYAGRWLKDFYNIFINEMKLIFSDSGVVVIFFVAGLVYPLLYNYIYKDGLVDEMAVAVVDDSRGTYSRRYIREVDATRECRIAYDCTDMEEAKDLMARQKVHGIIYIPSDFDDRLMLGEQATLSTYADMSTFLYYKNLTLATNLVMLDEVHKIQAEHYDREGLTAEDALTTIQPLEIGAEIRYNRTIGFTMTLMITALMLILQQTMFYGSSMLAGTLREEHRSFAGLTRNLSGFGIGRVVLGRGLAYLAIYIILGVYGIILVPWLFHLPVHAGWGDLLVLLLFFLVDCLFFCQTWSVLVTRRETGLVLLLFMSLVALFVTGFSWPSSNIPAFWKAVSYIFPTTFGCRAYTNLCNTGSLSSISPQIVAMTVQTVVYYVLACLSAWLDVNVTGVRRRRESLDSAAEIN